MPPLARCSGLVNPRSSDIVGIMSLTMYFSTLAFAILRPTSADALARISPSTADGNTFERHCHEVGKFINQVLVQVDRHYISPLLSCPLSQGPEFARSDVDSLCMGRFVGKDCLEEFGVIAYKPAGLSGLT